MKRSAESREVRGKCGASRTEGAEREAPGKLTIKPILNDGVAEFAIRPLAEDADILWIFL